jgi:peptidyl-prolyl cis-trans isomerase SurA
VKSAKSRLLGAAVLLSVAFTSFDAPAVVVERVVAVVGDKAILLTDLRRRARPRLLQMFATLPEGPQRAAAESQIMSSQIQQMVDEELVAGAALKAQQRATTEEVDKALSFAARVRGLTLSQLFEGVQRDTGMTEIEYRQEIRRQVLEGKLLNRFVANQRITKTELEQMYEVAKKQERMILLYQPAWIVLRLPKNATEDQVGQQMLVAQDIVARARAGEDFGALAQQYSADTKTAGVGGNLGIRIPVTSPKAAEGKYKLLAKPLEAVAQKLEQGAVSEPFRFGEAIVILTVTVRQPSRYPSVKAAEKELAQLVTVQKLQQVKTKWLKDLRRRTHVDVRYP